MVNPIDLDKAYNEFISNLSKWIPDGIIDVNLDLLKDLNLLDHAQFEEQLTNEQLPHYFHVVETSEKVTLFNHQFAIWIVPKLIDDQAVTYVMISLMATGKPHLELAFSTSGVYNTPKFVLRVLRHYLSEVIDTEEAISSIDKD